MGIQSVEATVAGIVMTVEVTPGDRISGGDVLLTIECMKMEIPVEAPRAGQVVSVLVGPGDPVTEGQVVATLDS